jgi:hypothetical protein
MRCASGGSSACDFDAKLTARAARVLLGLLAQLAGEVLELVVLELVV